MVEHSLGKGEVESSILSCSTSLYFSKINSLDGIGLFVTPALGHTGGSHCLSPLRVRCASAAADISGSGARVTSFKRSADGGSKRTSEPRTQSLQRRCMRMRRQTMQPSGSACARSRWTSSVGGTCQRLPETCADRFLTVRAPGRAPLGTTTIGGCGGRGCSAPLGEWRRTRQKARRFYRRQELLSPDRYFSEGDDGLKVIGREIGRDTDAAPERAVGP